jgi:hypothetical protein
MSILSHLSAGFVGAGVALIGAGIYIKKYYEKPNDIDTLCSRCKRPSQLTSLSPLSPSRQMNQSMPILHPLDTDYRGGNYTYYPMNTVNMKQQNRYGPKASDQYTQKNTSVLEVSRLYISNGNQEPVEENLGLPVLHDFAKLEANVQDVENALPIYQSELENNSVITATTSLDENVNDSQKNNTILILADMKARL